MESRAFCVLHGLRPPCVTTAPVPSHFTHEKRNNTIHALPKKLKAPGARVWWIVSSKDRLLRPAYVKLAGVFLLAVNGGLFAALNVALLIGQHP